MRYSRSRLFARIVRNSLFWLIPLSIPIVPHHLANCNRLPVTALSIASAATVSRRPSLRIYSMSHTFFTIDGLFLLLVASYSGEVTARPVCSGPMNK